MKFKLDENFGTRTKNVFIAAGHDVHGVLDEGLQGCSDDRLYKICYGEQRCLVTLDMDFSDVLRFPPAGTGGIAVIRVPVNPTLPLLEQLARQLLDSLRRMQIEGQLWIVEPGRIRVHQPEDG